MALLFTMIIHVCYQPMHWVLTRFFNTKLGDQVELSAKPAGEETGGVNTIVRQQVM